ncbi:MAG: hypothetical protein NTX75_12730 [Proteobacteria bacterium]|nr:hypothetical protein [Pseudomonadota bacterium]
MAISKNGIPFVCIDFPMILRISATVAESYGSSENSFKSEMALCKASIDFTEIYDVVDNVSTTALDHTSLLQFAPKTAL